MSNKIVIYSCTFGGYDQIKEPLVTDSRFEYIFISDTISDDKNSIWNFIYFDKRTMGSSESSRYVKMHPHQFFPDAEYSVYIDAKMQITDPSFYNLIIGAIGKNILWGSMQHPDRDCSYDEAVAAVEQLRAPYFKARKQMRYFASCGFPRHYGLTENCVILRKHNDSKVRKIDTEWWAIYARYKTGRDQLSLQFVTWKENFLVTTIFSGSWNFPGLLGHIHPNTRHRNFIQTKALGAKIHFTRICNRMLFACLGKF